ncbi:MAG: hypothetical protein R3A79_27610 [Nannocystaceae bacterium]
MAGDERFSEDEVAQILHRAAEIQPGRSLSLAEIEAVADEAGIEPALVRRAASEVRLAKRQPSAAPAVGGVFGPALLLYDRVVDGAVDSSMWDDIIAEIRRQLPLSGSLESIGKELRWVSHTGSESGRKIRVSVTPRGGKTLVRVEESTGSLAGGLYGGLMGGLGLGGLGWIIPMSVLAFGVPALIPLLLAAWLYVTFLLARTIFRSVIAHRSAQLERLADGVAELAGQLTDGSS